MKTFLLPRALLAVAGVVAAVAVGAAGIRLATGHRGAAGGLVSAVRPTTTSPAAPSATPTTAPAVPASTAPAGGPAPSPCPAPAPPAPGPGQTTVRVFFSCDRDGPESRPVAVSRVVPAGAPLLESALHQLLAGPTPAEQQAGLRSFFSAATKDMLKSATLDGPGHEVVDFADLRRVIPDAGTSAGSEQLLRQLDATVFADPKVRAVQYRIDGSCDTFFEWLQLDCEDRVR